MSEKKFPNGVFAKVVNTAHGSITKISIKKKEFIEYLNGLDDDNLYLNLDVLKRPNPTDKQTHYVVVDEWKPTSKQDDKKNVVSDNPFDSF
jgi:hypothetical protein